MATSPTQRAKRILEGQGYVVAITEKWNPFGGAVDPETGERRGIRQDAYGFVDMIAHRIGRTPVYLQVTSWSNVSSRVLKIIRDLQPAARHVVGSGVQVEVWGLKPGRIPRDKKSLKRVRLKYDSEQDAVVPLPPRTLHHLDL